MKPNKINVEVELLDYYQDLAKRTAPRDDKAYGLDSRYDGDLEIRKKLDQLIWSLGLTGEAGEFADSIKKVHGHGHDFDEAKKHHLAEELGDVMWYVAVLADSLGYRLSEVTALNINKLNKRYPDGFSIERSKKREK